MTGATDELGSAAIWALRERRHRELNDAPPCDAPSVRSLHTGGPRARADPIASAVRTGRNGNCARVPEKKAGTQKRPRKK
ncbi:hypothetical protein MTO96_013175 [Rhipicephalus appendiculatus]